MRKIPQEVLSTRTFATSYKAKKNAKGIRTYRNKKQIAEFS
ncbi:MAG: hypothetical protein ACTTHG_00680 [Treponemataceae bacterium]